MSQKFIDYESSYITPQLTLLKKFNKLLEYLRDEDEINGDKLYKHHISFDYIAYNGTTTLFECTLINKISDTLTLQNITKDIVDQITYELKGRVGKWNKYSSPTSHTKNFRCYFQWMSFAYTEIRVIVTDEIYYEDNTKIVTPVDNYQDFNLSDELEGVKIRFKDVVEDL